MNALICPGVNSVAELGLGQWLWDPRSIFPVFLCKHHVFLPFPWCWLPSPESVTRQRKHAEHLGCSEAIIPCLQLLAGKALRHAQPGWERFLSSGMER